MPYQEIEIQRGTNAPGYGAWEPVPGFARHRTETEFDTETIEAAIREAKRYKEKSHRSTRVVIFRRDRDEGGPAMMVPAAIPWSSDRRDKHFHRREFGPNQANFGIMGPG